MDVNVVNPRPFPDFPGIKKLKDGYLVDKSFKYNNKQRRFRKRFDCASDAISFYEEITAKAKLNQLPRQESELPTLIHYTNMRRSEAKADKIASYRDLDRILSAIESYFGADRKISDFSNPLLVSEWIDQMEKTPAGLHKRGRLSNKTIKDRLYALNGLLKRAQEDGELKRRPRVKYKKPKGRRDVDIKVEHIPLLINAMPPAPHPWRGMFLLTLYTGLRLSDLQRFTWDRVQPGLITYPSSKNGEPDRSFTPPQILTQELEALKATQEEHMVRTELVFAKAYHQETYCDTHVGRFWKSICRKIGVPRTTPHRLRSFAATLGLEEVGSDSAVQKWGAWRRPDVMNEHYLQADPLVQMVVNGIDTAITNASRPQIRLVKNENGGQK